MPAWDGLWIGADLATMTPGGEPYGAIAEGALGVRDGRISWLGRVADLPGDAERCAARVVDAGGLWITPGLIDCHTHAVFGGDRAAEFEMRLGGASYQDIAAAGGGILSTVAATRSAPEPDLVEAAAKRLSGLSAEGVTTIEIKSGYGLDSETEHKMLRAARALGERCPLSVVTSYLGAHTVPPEFPSGREGYLALVCEEVLPAVATAGLADAVDAFCEGIAFTAAETAAVFETARAQGLPVKLHADQLSDSGGAALAARFGALSADHLEYASDDGVAALAAAGTVAVLLPGAYYTLGGGRAPPVEALRAHGVTIAVASDCNPGSSPALSLLLMLNMACTLFCLTPEEALAGITRNAAAALGLAADRGTLSVGKRADFALWDIGHPAELAYWIGANACVGTVKDGAPVAR